MFYQLKITLRNLRQNGLYSAINIGGLAVSLAAVNGNTAFGLFHAVVFGDELIISYYKPKRKNNYYCQNNNKGCCHIYSINNIPQIYTKIYLYIHIQAKNYT